MFHVNKMRTHSSFLQCESLLLWGGIILLAMFFPTDAKKSFKIFAISAGCCLHSPHKSWVKLGGVEVDD